MTHRRLQAPRITRRSARSAALALTTGVALLSVAPGAAAMSGGNLVLDGDGEAVTGAAATVPAGAAWTTAPGGGVGLVAQKWDNPYTPSSLYFPGLIAGGSFDGGTRVLMPYSDGSAADVDATLNEQTIGLTADDRTALATGTVTTRFSAHVGGYQNQGDQLAVDAEWRDAQDAVLLTQSLAPATPSERGNVTGFFVRQDQQAAPPTATSVVIRLSGTRVVPPRHNGYADNIVLRLIGIPRLKKSFSAPVASTGSPVRLTYTIVNSEDLDAKSGWSFADDLPAGVSVASTSRPSTTCAGGRLVARNGHVTLAGDLQASQTTCTASFDVTREEPGTVETGPKQTSQLVGLHGPSGATSVRFDQAPPVEQPEPPVLAPPLIDVPPVIAPPDPPGPPDPPVVPPVAVAPPVVVPRPTVPSLVRPALRLRATAARSRVRAGSPVSLRLRVTNPTAVGASRVRVCQTLPDELLFVSSSVPTPEPAKSRRCWAVGSLAAKASWSTTVRVRVAEDGDGRLRSRVTASSPGAVATVAEQISLKAIPGVARARR